jgi:hypothetical protein
MWKCPIDLFYKKTRPTKVICDLAIDLTNGPT